MDETCDELPGEEAVDVPVERREAPESEEDDGQDDGAREQSAPPAPAAPVPADNRKTLKLVLTIAPIRSEAGEPAWRAQYGAQQDGCDPEFGVCDVADRLEALDLVPEFLARAEERWWRQPRKPKVKAAPKAAGKPGGKPGREERSPKPKPAAAPLAKQPAPMHPPAAPAATEPENETGTGKDHGEPKQGQLSLFG
jgi:hypothetical protein